MILALETPTPMVVEVQGDYDQDRLGELLADLALELEFAGEPQRVVVDLRDVGRLPPSFDVDLMVFLLEHAGRMERIAVVTVDPHASERAALLSLQSRRELRRFDDFDDALRWSMNP